MPQPYIIKKIEGKVVRAIYEYGLICEGDRVMVGLSGGKDSYSLLDLLVRCQRTQRMQFSLHACHVQATDMDYRADTAFMQRYCDEHGVLFHLRTIDVQYDPNDRKPACFICSWKRRKMLFATTNQVGCNKLALGHHMDDTIETLLMNMINHASISSIPPKLSMFDGTLELIRPLTTCRDAELRSYAAAKEFPTEVKRCQYEHDTHRTDVRELIEAMERINRDARKNIYRSTQNFLAEYVVGSPTNHKPRSGAKRKASDE